MFVLTSPKFVGKVKPAFFIANEEVLKMFELSLNRVFLNFLIQNQLVTNVYYQNPKFKSIGVNFIKQNFLPEPWN